MYQVNFSEQSMAEFNKLDIREQMHITDIICLDRQGRFGSSQ